MLVFRTRLGRLRAVTLRRFAACLLSLPMLQLGMVGAEVCATHADVAATSADASHHGTHGAVPESAPEPDCDVPTAADCCMAVASSCSLTLSTPEVFSNDVPGVAHVAIMVASRGMPHSATAAPETPPPRI